MTAPSEPIHPGVKRRAKADVPYTPRPISIFRPPPRDLGNYIIDAIEDAFSEAEERKWLANRLRAK